MLSRSQELKRYLKFLADENEYKKVHEALLNEGWSIDISMPVDHYIDIVVKVGFDKDYQAARAALFKHFEKNLEDIRLRINEKFPDRMHLINEAFNNHIEERYNSSILIFLSQIDGITNDLYDGSFFTK